VQKFQVPNNAQAMCPAGEDLLALSKRTLPHGVSSVSNQSLYYFQHNTIHQMKFIRLITFSNVIFADTSGRSLAVIVDSNPAGGTNVSVL
jgi:hypothetical protein